MKKIKLTQGKYALVDDEDFKKVNQHRWCANYRNGYWYAVRSIKKSNGKQTLQYMHRFIMNTPKKMETDHRNHNGFDNQRYNLRTCTRSDNQHNRQMQQGLSKYKGVVWMKGKKKWRTLIGLHKKRIHLGYFADEIAAAKAYDKKARELFGEFAYLNFRI